VQGKVEEKCKHHTGGEEGTADGNNSMNIYHKHTVREQFMETIKRVLSTLILCFTVLLGVLVFSGMELIFFIISCMKLCFGFVTRRVLIQHTDVLVIAERCLHIIKASFSASHSAPPSQ